ncbi:MAG: PHP domain-containing protein [Planctomycetota bacterium]|jgi:predicted metal-dependent phosphoesterase TrpH
MKEDNRKVDLHTHTNFSDGILTPEELVEEAIWKGLSAIGITDHDSLAGIERAQNAGEKSGIEVIPGVELSCELEGVEVHILGYLMNKSEVVTNCLKTLCADRQDRMKKMVEKAQSSGLDIKYEEVIAQANGDSVGRPHLARVMVEKGYVKNISSAFANYIGDDKAMYVAKRRLNAFDAIGLIREAEGISVLAHPGVNNLVEFIPLFAKNGIQGLEVFYSAHSPEIENIMLKMAQEYNLIATGGSDYHGDPKNDRELGYPSISYKYLEQMRDAMKIYQK